MRMQISTNSTKDLIFCPYPTLHNFSVSVKIVRFRFETGRKLSQHIDCPLPTNTTHI